MPLYITKPEVKPLPWMLGNQAPHLSQKGEEKKFFSKYYQKDTFPTSPGLILPISYLLKSQCLKAMLRLGSHYANYTYMHIDSLPARRNYPVCSAQDKPDNFISWCQYVAGLGQTSQKSIKIPRKTQSSIAATNPQISCASGQFPLCLNSAGNCSGFAATGLHSAMLIIELPCRYS